MKIIEGKGYQLKEDKKFIVKATKQKPEDEDCFSGVLISVSDEEEGYDEDDLTTPCHDWEISKFEPLGKLEEKNNTIFEVGKYYKSSIASFVILALEIKEDVFIGKVIEDNQELLQYGDVEEFVKEYFYDHDISITIKSFAKKIIRNVIDSIPSNWKGYRKELCVRDICENMIAKIICYSEDKEEHLFYMEVWKVIKS